MENGLDKIKEFFSDFGANIGKWIENNLQNIVLSLLIIATTTFVGLTVYFIYDYKQYKILLAKLAEYNKENLKEKAVNALNPQNISTEEIDEVQVKNEFLDKFETQETVETSKKTKGKRFK